MPEKFSPKKSLSKEIPADILNLTESEDMALIISEICLLNEVGEGEKIEKVAYQTARVLLGQLPSQLLAEELEKREGFASNTAYKIAEMIDQRIFSQIRESLAILYKREGKAPKKPLPSKKDTYREPIE